MNRRIIVGAVLVAAVAGILLFVRHGLRSEGAGNQSGSAVATSTVDNQAEASGSTASALSVRSSGAAASWAESDLSDAVKALLGLDDAEHNYNSLISAISGLSKELTNDDVAALRDMLTWPNDRFPEKMRPIEINAVKNDVLDRLLRQQQLPEGLGMQMVEMASDPANDPAWRDYCIQFMTPFYERATRELASKNTKEHEESQSGESVQPVDELNAVREAMVAALEERDGTLAGTSLIGLELLSRTHDEFDRDAIVAEASEIAADESASSGIRMTALRMSSLTGGDESSAETARNLAQTGETAYLRSAAIVTLGETGSADDRELIESYMDSENKQIAAAARLALQKMDARNL